MGLNETNLTINLNDCCPLKPYTHAFLARVSFELVAFPLAAFVGTTYIWTGQTGQAGVPAWLYCWGRKQGLATAPELLAANASICGSLLRESLWSGKMKGSF